MYDLPAHAMANGYATGASQSFSLIQTPSTPVTPSSEVAKSSRKLFSEDRIIRSKSPRSRRDLLYNKQSGSRRKLQSRSNTGPSLTSPSKGGSRRHSSSDVIALEMNDRACESSANYFTPTNERQLRRKSVDESMQKLFAMPLSITDDNPTSRSPGGSPSSSQLERSIPRDAEVQKRESRRRSSSARSSSCSRRSRSKSRERRKATTPSAEQPYIQGDDQLHRRETRKSGSLRSSRELLSVSSTAGFNFEVKEAQTLNGINDISCSDEADEHIELRDTHKILKSPTKDTKKKHTLSCRNLMPDDNERPRRLSLSGPARRSSLTSSPDITRQSQRGSHSKRSESPAFFQNEKAYTMSRIPMKGNTADSMRRKENILKSLRKYLEEETNQDMFVLEMPRSGKKWLLVDLGDFDDDLPVEDVY